MDKRGSGRTTAQMKEAPRDSVFIGYGNIAYYQRLAAFLQRNDLRIHGPQSLENYHQFAGRRNTIVVDHSMDEFATERQRDTLRMLAVTCTVIRA